MGRFYTDVTDVPCRTRVSRVELFLRFTFLKTSIYKKCKRNMSKYFFLCVERKYPKGSVIGLLDFKKKKLLYVKKFYTGQ